MIRIMELVIKINDEILKFNVVENKEHIINVTNKDIIYLV